MQCHMGVHAYVKKKPTTQPTPTQLLNTAYTGCQPFTSSSEAKGHDDTLGADHCAPIAHCREKPLFKRCALQGTGRAELSLTTQLKQLTIALASNTPAVSAAPLFHSPWMGFWGGEGSGGTCSSTCHPLWEQPHSSRNPHSD